MTKAKSVRRAVGITFLLSVINCVYAQGQQPNTYSSPTIGSTPLALSPGSPAGSYALSGFDSVNLFNGHLNFRLPLLQIGGRGSAGYTMMLKIDQKWRVDTATFLPPPGPHGEQPPETTNRIPVGYWWTGLEPGYGPGVMQGRHSGDGSRTCAGYSPTQRFFDQTLTRITFTAPDGTEYDFRDELTGGTPHNLATGEQCSGSPFSRGRVWITDDGSASTFIADQPITDQYADPTVYPGDLIPPDSGGALFYPSGFLFMRDGTRYRIDGGLVSWINDRNGNKINFPPGGPITDSLNRKVTIIYADFNANPPRMYDEIKFTGFDQTAHGTDRSIKIFYTNLGSVLRSGTTQTTIQLFGNALDQSGSGNFDPTVISSVSLPDGRQYQFRYNAFGELARVVLPTGGAIEYDYDAGVGAANNSGLLISPNYEIYRRVVERRVYPDGGTGVAFESKTTYSRPEGVVPNDAFVLMQTKDSSNNLFKSEKHYFFGKASPTIFRFANDYSIWSDGKEYQTKLYDTSGTTQLKQIDHSWINGALLSQQPGPATASQNPHITDTTTTLSDVTPVAQVARQAFSYDIYNNVTDTCDYDFGAGTPGSLLRHSHTEYMKVHPVSGVDYANSISFNLTQSKKNIHLRNLPLFEVINTDCSNILNQAARTAYEYDDYTTPDMKHAALTPRGDISSMYPLFDTAWTTRGNVTGVTRWLNTPASSITSYQQYDIAGNVTKAIDPLGNITTVDYTDNFGNPDGSTDERYNPPELVGLKTYAFATSVTNSLTQTSYTQFNYYAGKAVDGKDVNNTVTSAYYQDLLDRPSKLIHAANDFSSNSQVRSQTTFLYDDAARTITTRSDQNALGDGLLRSDALYDGLGRTVETRHYETATAYITTKQIYDPMSRTRQVSNPYRTGDTVYWTTTDYDGLSRVKTITTPDLSVVTTTYYGSQTTVRDQANKQRRSVTDGLGRLTTVDEMLVFPSTTVYATTTYGYDPLDDLIKVTQGVQTRFFMYDSLKRLIRARNPEQDVYSGLNLSDPLTSNSQWSIGYVYDADSNLTQRTDARGIITNYGYDALNRLSNRTYPGDSTPGATYSYDSTSVPYSKGRLTSVSTSVSNHDYLEYDALGQIKRSRQTTLVDSTQQTYQMGYGYDLAGKLTSETYPSGRQVLTEYDSAGRIAGVRGGSLYYAGATPTDTVNRIQYAAHGAISAMKLGNAKWEHTNFNSRLQPTQIGLGTSSADSSTLKLDYGYGTTANNGNVLSQTITSPQTGGGNLILTQGYTYDDLNRLTIASENSGTTWSQNYGYDRYGNRWVPQSTGYTPDPTLCPSQQNHISATTNRIVMNAFSYDFAGNQKTQIRNSQNETYDYDAENRVVKINNGAIGQCFYDGDGHRVKKIDNGGTTVFVYDVTGRLTAEYHSDPSPTAQGGGGTSYLTTDHLGSTRVVTNSTGGVKARYDYLPFGEEIASTIGDRGNVAGYGGADSTKQKFTQKERDSESGLDYFLARYYSSAQGRFTSADRPLADQNTKDPQSWNLFPYVRNNPLKYVDPLGRQRSEMSDDKKTIEEKRRKAAEQERLHRAQVELKLAEILGETASGGAVNIYYWAPAVLPGTEDDSLIRVGHMSMMLPDGTYISLFPDGAHASYKADFLSEGGNATRIYELRGLTGMDHQIIKAWWDGEKAKDNYKALSNNCSDVVRSALLMGGLNVPQGTGLGNAMGVLSPLTQLSPFSTPGNTETQMLRAVAAQQSSKRGDMRILTLRRTR